ncbi:MAG: ComF family protein [Planctomycetota bacterium]|nr:ComF family protein [Planctomycetota bacterium]
MAYEALLTPPASSWLRQAAQGAAGLLYPPHCMACGHPLEVAGNGALCAGCARLVPWIGPDRCRRCGDAVGQGMGVQESCPSCETHPPVFVKAVCAIAEYREPLRALILGVKFARTLQAVPLLAELLAQRVRDTRLLDGFPAEKAVLAPVPMHGREFAVRGFNQAEEVAALAAKHLKVACSRGLLRKVRATRPQATLGHEARRTNLKDAFAPGRKAARWADGCVILVDDVMTTGSTAGECARTLYAQGVKDIRLAVLARG